MFNAGPSLVVLIEEGGVEVVMVRVEILLI